MKHFFNKSIIGAVVSALFAALIYCSPTLAQEKDYIVKLPEQTDDFEEIGGGYYLVDESRLDEVSDKALLIEEDAPIELPPDEDSEPDEGISLYSDDAPNDTYYSTQAYMSLMGIDKLREQGYTGKGVRVAVIDSGCYTAHEDFENTNFEEGYNYCTDTTDVTDTSNHGTGVMSIMAASVNNGKGIAGIAPDATYIPLVVYRNGSGKSSDIVRAIYDAVDKYDCDIMNLSLGTNLSSTALEDACEYADNAGVVIVAAAGNGGDTEYCYPASYACVFSVGALNDDLTIASTSRKNDKVKVSGLLSATMCSTSGGYKKSTGTSFASPMVCGAMILLTEAYGMSTYDSFYPMVQAATADVGDIGRDYAGYGLLDANAGLKFLLNNDTIFISPIFNTSDGKIRLKFFSKGANNAAVVLAYYQDGEVKKLAEEDAAFSNKLYAFDADEAGDKLRYFAVESLSNMKNLSEAREITIN